MKTMGKSFLRIQNMLDSEDRQDFRSKNLPDIRIIENIKCSYTVAIIVTFFAICLTPVDCKVTSLSSKATFVINTRDYGLKRSDNQSAVAINPSDGGRRLRHPALDKDLIEFRRYLHEMRLLRQGAKISSSKISTRDIASERFLMGQDIAREVPCGECKIKKEWIRVEKPGCVPNYVFVTVCQGMCETHEIPDINPPYVTKNHRVCRPMRVEYRKINLERCKPGVNTQHLVPFATSCLCLRCRTTNTACRLL